MRNDEFNTVNITNERETYSSFEFGKTQRAEFSIQKENASTPNRDEINSSTNRNHENIKEGKRFNNNDAIEKAANSSEAGAASSSTAAAETAATSATSATASASAVGATSAGVVAATAVVAVTVVSATVGVNIYAQCHFEYLKASHNSISYGLVLESELTDPEQEGNLQYRIWVENENQSYYAYNELHLGTNEGDFYNLTPNTEYAVTVASLTTVGGEELRGLPIYSGTVKTADLSAHVSFNYIRPGQGEISYELELEVNPDDDNQYAIWLDDGEYDVRYEELIPLTNEGVFTDLWPDTTYNLSVASITYTEDQEAIKGEEIYSTTVSTLAIQATVDFNHLEAGENRIDYGLDLEIAVGNTNTYAIWLENDDLGFSTVEMLEVGENTGTFSDLTPNTTYLLSVANVGPSAAAMEKGDDILYEENITTQAATIQPSMELVFNKLVDMTNNSIEIELSYEEDPDNEVFTDLQFEIFDEEGHDKVYNLEKKQGTQTLYGNDSAIQPGGLYPFRADGDNFDFTSGLSMSYVFSYKENGVTVSDQSESGFKLKNKAGEFSGVDFNKKADYETNSFEIALDYYDPDNKYSNFVLEMTNAVGTVREYALEKTLQTQTICGDRSVGSEIDDTMDFSNPNEFFTLILSYSEANVADPYRITLMNNEVFEDTGSHIVQLTNFVIFEEADFETNTFYVQLTYQDDLNKLADFNLYLSGGGEAHTFTLEKTTAKQAIQATWIDDQSTTHVMDLSTGEFSYLFSYTIYGNLAQIDDQILFVDTEGRESVINSVDIIQEADLMTQEFSVDVDIVNTLGKITSARLVLTDQQQDAISKSFDLELEKSVQSFNKNATDFVIRGRVFNYVIYYTENSTEETFTSGEVQFTDSEGRKSEISSITFSSDADFNLKVFKASVVVVDDFGIINPNGDLIIEQPADQNTGTPAGNYDVPITLNPNITGEQVIDGSNFEDLDLSASGLTYRLMYTDSGLNTQVEALYGELSFSGVDTYMEGVNSDFVALPNNGNYYLPVTLEYNDPLNVYSSTFELVTVVYNEDTEENEVGEVIGVVEKTKELQLIDVTDFINDHDPDSSYSLIGLNTNVGLEGLTEEQIQVANDIHISAGYFESLEIDSSEPTLNLQLYMHIPNGTTLNSLQLTFMDEENGQWAYDLEVSFDYFNNMYTIDLTDNQDYQSLLALMSNGTEFNVQVAYQSGAYADYIYIYSGVIFSVI